MNNRYQVAKEDAGMRVDAWLRNRLPEVSRSRWKALLKSGDVRVDGADCKPSQTLRGGERIAIDIPPPEASELIAEDIPLDIIYEDADLIVVDKPAGLVVHPAAGHRSGTLVNALLHHCGDLKGIGGELRPGIVHRLDKDTSGALVAAKTEQAMTGLSEQFKMRRTEKEYAAIVWGVPDPGRGTIETEIGRSRHDRKRMSVATARGRRAVTHYEVIESFGSAALLRIGIETGRTHQIRVHMAHIRHPVVGDRNYGGKLDRQSGLPVARQMLHARRLAFTHPIGGQPIEAVAPLPDDMEALISLLRVGVGPAQGG